MANAMSAKRQLTGAVNILTGDSLPLPNLPEEIITEILLRLPVKSLLKFRCVSKYFLTLISSPQFVKAHLKLSTKNNTGLHNRLVFGSGLQPAVLYSFSLYPDKNENSLVDTSIFDYPFNNPNRRIRIVGSCNGLICIVVDPCCVVLWNPATRKYKNLPISDKSILGLEYGFGYDSLNNDYKVFEFSHVHDEGAYENKTQLMVYSSRDNSWQTLDWAKGKIFDGPGLFVNGSIHWKIYYYDDPHNSAVIKHNVTTQVYTVVELPIDVSDDAQVMLGVSGDCLCALYDYRSYMDVWVMEEYGVGESWSKRVCFPYFFCTMHNGEVRPKLLFISENGGVIMSLGSDLIMYKPSQYHEIYRLDDDIEVEVATYSESLLSPDLVHLPLN